MTLGVTRDLAHSDFYDERVSVKIVGESVWVRLAARHDRYSDRRTVE